MPPRNFPNHRRKEGRKPLNSRVALVLVLAFVAVIGWTFLRGSVAGTCGEETVVAEHGGLYAYPVTAEGALNVDSKRKLCGWGCFLGWSDPDPALCDGDGFIRDRSEPEARSGNPKFPQNR